MKKVIFISSLIIFLNIKFASSQTVWGESGTRTENRDNAGLQGNEGATSGFYQTYNPINFPSGANDWWHLIDVRHSNPVNNYAMQFAGSFFNQELYFRKTNGSGATSWNRILMLNNDGNLINNNIKITTSAGQSFYTGYQFGNTYSFPKGIFLAKTDNPNGVSNYYFEGETNGTTNFSVRADGLGYFAGNLGLGTSNPEAKLHIQDGGVFIKTIRSNSQVDFPLITGTQAVNGVSGHAGIFLHEDGNSGFGQASGLVFKTSLDDTTPTTSLMIRGNGKVGIGTTNPDEKLTVKGKIHAEEVRVDLSFPAPDYVFEKDYALTSLSEIQKYIQENKHLPEVPSAKEMEKNGINLSEMNMLLLKKVEELTLHLIETNRKVEALQKENIEIKKSLN